MVPTLVIVTAEDVIIITAIIFVVFGPVATFIIFAAAGHARIQMACLIVATVVLIVVFLITAVAIGDFIHAGFKIVGVVITAFGVAAFLIVVLGRCCARRIVALIAALSLVFIDAVVLFVGVRTAIALAGIVIVDTIFIVAVTAVILITIRLVATRRLSATAGLGTAT